jgi:PadR family transcriptional regulator PadR
MPHLKSIVNGSGNHDVRWEVQLRKGCLDMAILAAIWSKKLYGLEILKHISETAKLEIAEGTLYPILMRLKQEGLLESEWVEADAGHPRKYYWLTEDGRQRVVDMVRTWDEFTTGIADLLVPVRRNKNDDERPG